MILSNPQTDHHNPLPGCPVRPCSIWLPTASASAPPIITTLPATAEKDGTNSTDSLLPGSSKTTPELRASSAPTRVQLRCTKLQ